MSSIAHFVLYVQFVVDIKQSLRCTSEVYLCAMDELSVQGQHLASCQ